MTNNFNETKTDKNIFLKVFGEKNSLYINFKNEYEDIKIESKNAGYKKKHQSFNEHGLKERKNSLYLNFKEEYEAAKSKFKAKECKEHA